MVDVKDPTVSFTKGRQAVIGTIAKFKFLVKPPESISSAAQPYPQSLMLPCSLVLHNEGISRNVAALVGGVANLL